MRKFIVGLGVLALAAQAWAGALSSSAPTVLAPRTLGQAASQRATVYSNTATAGYSIFDVASENHELGDDLHLTAGGTIDTVEFSIVNPSYSGNTAPLTTADVTVRFYNIVGSTYPYVGGVTFSAVNLALPAGYYTTLTTPSIASFNLNVSANIVATVQLTNIVGGAAWIGQVVADPPSVGSSSDFIWEDGVGYSVPFGGNPVGNFLWAVNTVPEPASLSLLGLALALLRRR